MSDNKREKIVPRAVPAGEDGSGGPWRDAVTNAPRPQEDERMRMLRDELNKIIAPYGEWCRNPDACAGKGYCPLDPTCGD